MSMIKESSPEDRRESGDDWLTIKEASDYLKVSEQTIFRWMRSGKISFFKFGASTRFRRSNLDMVAQKITSEAEVEHATPRCLACGHSKLVEGRIRSTGRIYFQPDRLRFFVLTDSLAAVKARTCPVCGHMQLFADTNKLAKLIKDEDKEDHLNEEEEATPQEGDARQQA